MESFALLIAALLATATISVVTTLVVMKTRRSTSAPMAGEDVRDRLGEMWPALASSAVGMCRISPGGQIESFNDAFLVLGGRSREELVGKDFDGVCRPTDDHFGLGSKELSDTGRADLFEARIDRPNGTYRMVLVAASLVNPKGRAAGSILAIVIDISNRRQFEERLLELAGVFENSAEGILITDAAGVIKRVNPAFTKITGYRADEVTGENPRILKSNHHDRQFYADLWASLVEHGTWSGEIWNRRKSGEAYPEWLSITAIKNADGEVSHYVSVFRDISESKKSEELLYYRANHDALTELPNRVLFEDRLQRAVSRARRAQKMVAVLFIDLDDFKEINDGLGHTVGDEVLKEVGQRLQSSLREGDSAARQGGDEFMVLLPDLPDRETAMQVISRIESSLEGSYTIHGEHLTCTSSIGISFFPDHGDDPQALVQHADAAMYEGKKAGRNTTVVYSALIQERLKRRTELEKDLRLAVERDELKLVYQPKVDLAQGTIVGFEALLRWERDGLQAIGPREFSGGSEICGIVREVDSWIFETACHDCAEWRRVTGADLSIAINLSSGCFRSDSFGEFLQQCLKSTGLDPSAVILEITERELMRDVDEAAEIMNRIRELGVRFALDDFGTGVSSLNLLSDLPLCELKLDRSLIVDVPGLDQAVKIAWATMTIAQSLQVKVVAEGVESSQQLEFLKRHGCDLAQGYLLSPPISAGQVLAIAEKKVALETPEETFLISK